MNTFVETIRCNQMIYKPVYFCFSYMVVIIVRELSAYRMFIERTKDIIGFVRVNKMRRYISGALYKCIKVISHKAK